jgi:hypothetical protein
MTVTLHITEKARTLMHLPGRQRTSKSLAAATTTANPAGKHNLSRFVGMFFRHTDFTIKGIVGPREQ